ncbi:MAG: hypothetical protein HY804_02975 [Nitrospinae bacterium]|nr:hypothetical protein [Nitrospinota bacterium]
MKLTTIMAFTALGAGAALYTGSGAEQPVSKTSLPAGVSRAGEAMKSGDELARKLWNDTRERGRKLIHATLVEPNEHPLER